MKTVAVLVPVLNRPQNVAPLVASFRSSAEDAELYFVANENDRAEVEAISAAGTRVLFAEGVSWASKINHGYRRTEEPWLLCGADDLYFRPGWLEPVRPLLPHYEGVVGSNDLGNARTIAGEHSTHPLVSRAYADRFGTLDGPGAVCHEGYRHWYVDDELCKTAQARGRWLHLRDFVIEHRHPAWGKAPNDSTYVLGQSFAQRDAAVWAERARLLAGVRPC